MIALVTGASSGIGYEIAKDLSLRGYDIIAVARSEDKLNELKKDCNTNVDIILKDLSNVENCNILYDQIKDREIEVLVNCAGFGLHGKSWELDLERELDMIYLNICSVHILTKLFLKDMIRKNKGYILNVSSSASFTAGPLMSSYYASKAYVTNLSRAISKELRVEGSSVSVSSLCPGPVDTNFNNAAKIQASVSQASPEFVAKYGVKKMFLKKSVIVPGFKNKLALFSTKILPSKLVETYIYKVQKAKKIE